MDDRKFAYLNKIVANVPKDEEEWKVKREMMGFSTPDDIILTLLPLCGWKPGQPLPPLTGPQRNLMAHTFIILTVVELKTRKSTSEVDVMTADFLSGLYGRPRDPDRKFSQRLRSSALSLIRFMGRLHREIAHRVFESVLLHGKIPPLLSLVTD